MVDPASRDGYEGPLPGVFTVAAPVAGTVPPGVAVTFLSSFFTAVVEDCTPEVAVVLPGVIVEAPGVTLSLPVTV
jgi:hypothetical protein